MATQVIVWGSDGVDDVSVKVDYLWNENEGLRNYSLQVGTGKSVVVNARELEDAMRFCIEHQVS